MGHNERSSGLQHVADFIEKGGLPSTDEMRAAVNESERERFRADLDGKLSEYRVLFDKFENNSITDEERGRMGALLTEFEELQRRLGITT